jgi:hypothetical protein
MTAHKKTDPFFRHPVVKNILSALAVAFFGYILLNLTFLFDALYHYLIQAILDPFIPGNMFADYFWIPYLMHLSFVVIIGLISWLVFRSKLHVLYKAIYLTVPLAVVLVTFGIFFYFWPIAQLGLGGLFSLGVLYFLYRTRQPWLYYYTVILICATLTIFTLSGGQI